MWLLLAGSSVIRSLSIAVRALTVAALIATPASVVSDGTLARQAAAPYLQQIAPDVYVWQRTEPSGLAVYANNVFIIRENDVIVVDTDMRPSITRGIIAQLKQLTPKPVSHVINTHWHDDHFVGNAAYREAYPGVRFVGHRSTPEDLRTLGAPNRKGMIDGIPPMLDQLRKGLAAGQNLAGQPLSAEARAAHEADLIWGEAYLKEVPAAAVIEPDVLVDERLQLGTAARPVDVLHAGPAHTRADLIVHLPIEGVVIAGDVLIHPIPLLGNANLTGWMTALDRIAALQPRLLVPGHGPVMPDLGYLSLTREFLADLRARVAEQAGRGATLEETRKAIDLSAWRTKFAGDSTHRAFIFGFYTAGPGIAAAHAEAVKRKAGPGRWPRP
jgi:glyoxylase-like metal-dependent hydrolase (beta-lactamase superfamily II)